MHWYAFTYTDGENTTTGGDYGTPLRIAGYLTAFRTKAGRDATCTCFPHNIHTGGDRQGADAPPADGVGAPGPGRRKGGVGAAGGVGGGLGLTDQSSMHGA